MFITTDPLFQSAIDTLAFPGVAVGHRLISPGDEHALLKEEVPALAASVVNCALPKGPTGAPVWPAGIVGSLAHDSRVAVAAVGMRADVGALGIDVEPAECLPSELLDLVATPQERLSLGDDVYRGRLLFVAKEAVYKAVYPLDQTFLEHHDVEINLSERKAVVRSGRVVELRFSISAHHLVALAFLRA